MYCPAPARVWAAFWPYNGQDCEPMSGLVHLHRPYDRPKTSHRGAQFCPRSSRERPPRSRSQPKTASKGPKSDRRLPKTASRPRRQKSGCHLGNTHFSEQPFLNQDCILNLCGRPTSGLGSTSLNPKRGPGPPAEAQRVVKTAKRGPKSGPRPPQRPPRPQERPKTGTVQLDDRCTAIGLFQYISIKKIGTQPPELE